MIDYTKPQIWDTIWSRPYENYKKHHQVFWKMIRQRAYGKVLDLACGAACYWNKTDIRLYGCDFSKEAIKEAKKNNPMGIFHVDTLPCKHYNDENFDTIVLSGLVNYYQNLTPLMRMVKKAIKPQGLCIVTINVIDDFPGRHWDLKRIEYEFGEYGKVEAYFAEKIGWFVTILIS